MTTRDCSRWISIVDRDVLGESISAPDREFVGAHAHACPHCRLEADLWDQLAELPAPGDSSDEAPRAAALRERAKVSHLPSRPHRRAYVTTGLAFAAAAAAIVALCPMASSRLVPSGQGGEVAIEWTLAEDVPHCFAESQGVQACLFPGSKARPLPQAASRHGYELAQGQLAVELGPQPPERPFVVTTESGDIEAVGTIFAVEVSAEGGVTTARLVEGRVRVRSGGATVTMEPGQRLVLGRPETRALSDREASTILAVLGDASASGQDGGELVLLRGERPSSEPEEAQSLDRRPSRAAPSPSELLERARSLRRDGRHGEAAAAYQRLRTSYPGSAEAQAALVSLGQLQLSRLREPAAALRSFDAYLARPGGGLEQEARFGRIRALRALGRGSDERQAVELFLQRFPSSPRAATLRERLTELGEP